MLAINEAMMLDAGKSNGCVTDDQQPFFDRQTELATLVEDMMKTGHERALSDSKVRRTRRGVGPS